MVATGLDLSMLTMNLLFEGYTLLVTHVASIFVVYILFCLFEYENDKGYLNGGE